MSEVKKLDISLDKDLGASISKIKTILATPNTELSISFYGPNDFLHKTAQNVAFSRNFSGIIPTKTITVYGSTHCTCLNHFSCDTLHFNIYDNDTLNLRTMTPGDSAALTSFFKKGRANKVDTTLYFSRRNDDFLTYSEILSSLVYAKDNVLCLDFSANYPSSLSSFHLLKKLKISELKVIRHSLTADNILKNWISIAPKCNIQHLFLIYPNLSDPSSFFKLIHIIPKVTLRKNADFNFVREASYLVLFAKKENKVFDLDLRMLSSIRPLKLQFGLTEGKHSIELKIFSTDFVRRSKDNKSKVVFQLLLASKDAYDDLSVNDELIVLKK